MRGSMRSQVQASFTLGSVLIALLFPLVGGYQDGDFVSISRRGQFHEVRTHWHDLLARHCPHFGRTRVVVIPVPQPLGFKSVDTYKIGFSIAGDRLYTTWLKILGGSTPEVPMIEMTLVRMGEDIKSISAEVQPVPEHYSGHHAALVEEWANATQWPKHLLVDYKWKEEQEVDAVPGMYILFATALVAAIVVAVSALAHQQDNLQEFAGDIISEPDIFSPTPSSGRSQGDASAGGIYLSPGPPAYRMSSAPKAD